MKRLLPVLWITSKIALAFILFVALLVGVFCAYENHTGHRKLQSFIAQLENEGFRFGPEAFRPAPVPEAENFGATPLLRPLFDVVLDPKTGFTKLKDADAPGRIAPNRELTALAKAAQGGFWRSGETPAPDLKAVREALAPLEKYAAELHEITSAARRPFAVYPLRFDAGFGLGLHYLSPLMNLTRAFSGRASAFLLLQRHADAFENAITSFQITAHLEDPPSLLTALVYSAETMVAIRPLWDGLRLHAWDARQLDALDQALTAIHPARQYVASVKGEMALLPVNFAQLAKQPLANRNQDNALHEVTNAEKILNAICLPGWFHDNERLLLQWHYRSLNEVDATSERFFPEYWAENLRAAEAVPWSPRSYQAKVSLGVFPRLVKMAAVATQEIQFGQVAIALERYWQAHHEYPPSLDAESARAHDVCNGEPLHYRLENGGYRLWSVGWNLADDDGAVARYGQNSGGANIEQGDWAWVLPGDPAVTK